MDEQSKQEGGRLRPQAIPPRSQGAGLPGLISVKEEGVQYTMEG